MNDRHRQFLEEHHAEDLSRSPHQKGVELLYWPRGVPESGEYLPQTIASIKQQEARLKSLGVQPKVGMEIEFATYRETIGPNADHWKSIKAKALVSAPPGSELAEKIDKFGPREAMIYDLINLDPRTKDMLEPLPPDGYFDAGDMLELKLKLVSPTQMEQNLNLLSEVLYQKVTQDYGLVFARQHNAGFHVNLSFWDDKGNMFDPGHPEFLKKGKRIAEGLLRSVFDTFPLQLDNRQLMQETEAFCNLSVSREGSLRFAKGRIEIRPTKEDKYDPLLLLAIGLAGAEFGARESKSPTGEIIKDPERTLPVDVVEKSSVEEITQSAYKVVRHVLNGSTIGRDRRLVLPEDYIKDKAPKLGKELLGINPDVVDGQAAALMSMFGGNVPPHADGVLDFFRKIRLKKAGDQYEVVWPTTQEGKYDFADTKGNRHSIDVAALSKELKTVNVHSAFQSRGYDVGMAFPGGRDILESRQQRMLQSPVLQSLSPELSEAMNAALDKRIAHISGIAAKMIEWKGLEEAIEDGWAPQKGRPPSRIPPARTPGGLPPVG